MVRILIRNLDEYGYLACPEEELMGFLEIQTDRGQELFAKVAPNFERTSDYLAKIRNETAALADKHYKMGLQCYRDQKLNEAIAEWQKVLELDASHAKAREYISKANKLLEALKK